MDAPDDFFVTMDHLHGCPSWGSRPGFCHDGARALCARYGLDWLSIVRAGGIPAGVLIATGDGLALHLVEYARQEVAAREAAALLASDPGTSASEEIASDGQ